MTHEYWLYITSSLILLLIISNVLNWNILAIILIFLLSLLIIAAGLYRIVTDPFIVLFRLFGHIGVWLWAGLRRIWIGMRHIAILAMKIVKFLYNFLQNIRKLYDRFVRRPFIWIHEKLVELEDREKANAATTLQTVTQKLEVATLDALKTIDPAHAAGPLPPPPTYPIRTRGKIVIFTLAALLLIGVATLVYTKVASSIALTQAIANATATATAKANVIATAETIAANPYPSYLPGHGVLALYDPLRNNSNANNWDVGSDCSFTDGGYHVKVIDSGVFASCSLSPSITFSDFVFEVQMKIIKGYAGGVIFRAGYGNTTGNFIGYVFRVGEDGYYILYSCHPKDTTSCSGQSLNGSNQVINQGLNQINLIDVVVKGSTIMIYVNRQKIENMTDTSYSHGQIGVIADPSTSPTEVVYSNAKVWTL